MSWSLNWTLLSVAGVIIGLLLAWVRSLHLKLFLAEHEAKQQKGVALETDRVWNEVGAMRGWSRQDGESLQEFLSRSQHQTGGGR